MTFDKMQKIDLTKEGYSSSIPIDIYKDKETTFKAMADEMVNIILEKNKRNEKTLFIVPLGPTGQYKYFVERVNKERISLKDVTFINMDEYMHDQYKRIDSTFSYSFVNQMYDLCYNKIDKDLLMQEDQRIFPQPDKLDHIDKVIERHGGVDCCFGGIGITGHIAFNEPEGVDCKQTYDEFIHSKVRVAKISEQTKVVNSMDIFDGAYYMMPDYCITIGMDEIRNSKKIRLYCFRDWHRMVVRRACFDKPTTKFPVTLLQEHKDIRIGIPKYIALPN